MNTSLSADPRPPLAASTPAPETKAPSVPTVQINLLGPLEGRKELPEALRAQAGERLEHAAVAGNLGVADHWGFLYWSCLQYSTSGSITDRVYLVFRLKAEVQLFSIC